MSNISNQTLLCGYAFPDPSTKPETLKLQNTEEVPEELLKVQILETITRFSDSLGEGTTWVLRIYIWESDAWDEPWKITMSVDYIKRVA